jgi:bifunctional DNase/RNase
MTSKRVPRLRLVLVLTLASACRASLNGGAPPHAVEVRGVEVDPRTASPVVLLEETEGQHRRLPIWIGAYEAQSIAAALEKVPAPRPNPHDLIKSIVEGLHGTLERVVITELRNGTYYATLDVSVDGRTVQVDARPSDAIAVAVRTGTPVFATGLVLEQAGDAGEAGPALEIRLPAPEPRGPVVPTVEH